MILVGCWAVGEEKTLHIIIVYTYISMTNSERVSERYGQVTSVVDKVFRAGEGEGCLIIIGYG